jgi:hypothetical protein
VRPAASSGDCPDPERAIDAELATLSTTPLELLEEVRCERALFEQERLLLAVLGDAQGNFNTVFEKVRQDALARNKKIMASCCTMPGCGPCTKRLTRRTKAIRAASQSLQSR